MGKITFKSGETRKGESEGERETGREGRREKGRERKREGGREGEREGGRQGGREGGRKEGEKEGRRERGREGGRERVHVHERSHTCTCKYNRTTVPSSFPLTPPSPHNSTMAALPRKFTRHGCCVASEPNHSTVHKALPPNQPFLLAVICCTYTHVPPHSDIITCIGASHHTLEITAGKQLAVARQCLGPSSTCKLILRDKAR